jgi:aminopeptidase
MLADLPAADCARVAQANARAYEPVTVPIAAFSTNWTIVAYPCTAWAVRVFPDLDPQAATNRLAEQIFRASRLFVPDPIAEWRRHTASLVQRVEYLNRMAFSALHFVGEGTDLIVGLAEGHLWQGGVTKTAGGISTICNMPTEEVFTAPHRDRVDGWVTASKAFALDGSMICGLRVRFVKGRAVEIEADQGKERIDALLATDNGACRLGEVALVPHSSPIAQSNILFQNMLFDENAASHLAFGQSYAKCFRRNASNRAEIARRGGNASAIHQDWMIGTATMNVFAITKDGKSERLMQQGEWV